MVALLQRLYRSIGWSNRRQSWLERAAGRVWATGAVAAWYFGGKLAVAQRLLLGGLLLVALVFLLRRGWVKILGPVFFYDAVRSARRGRNIAVRTLYALAILGLLYWTYFIWRLRSVEGGIPINELATFAESFFYVFLAVQSLAVVLLTPAYVAGAIAEEKERQTVDYLLATDLRNREIVLGKLVSRLGTMALLVLSGLPILSLMEMLGGIEPRLLLAAFAVTGLTMLSLAAVSILCSVYARRAREAILVSYLIVLAYPILGVALIGLFRALEIDQRVLVPIGVIPALTAVSSDDPSLPPVEEPFTLGDLAERFNDGSLPVFVYRLLQELSTGSTVAEALPHLLTGYAVAHLLMTAICLGWSIYAVRRVALRQWNRAPTPLRGAPVVRRPKIGRWPLLWKEGIAESGFRTSLARRGITYAIVIAVLVPTGAIVIDGLLSGTLLGRDMAIGWAQDLVLILGILVLLSVAVRASSTISGERDRQTLDVLLTMPVTSDAILFSKWLGCLLGLRWIAGSAGIALVVCALAGGHALSEVVCVGVAITIYTGLIAMIGVAFSLVCKTTLRATLATLFTTVALVVGHWSLWLIYLPFLFITDQPGSVYEGLGRFHVALTPPAALLWLMTPDGFSWLPGTHNGELSVFLALALWAAGTLGVWFVASRRFRRDANRVPIAPPGPPPEERTATATLSAALRQRQRRRRIAQTLAMLVPVAAVVGSYVYVAHESERRLQAVVGELDATEPGWRLAELEAARKVLPIDQNSAEQVRTTRRLLPRVWPGPPPVAANPQTGIFDRLPQLPPEQRLSDSDRTEIRELLDAVQPARSEALKLADMPEGRYPIAWSPVVFWTPLNDQSESRTVSQLLRLESAACAEDGDAAGALVAALAALNVARAIGDEPLMISQIIRLSERRIALEALERALAQGEPPEAMLARLQKALEEEEREPILKFALRGERAFFHEGMDELRTGQFKPSQMLGGGPARDLAAAASAKAAHPWGLRHLTTVLALTDLPIHEQIGRATDLEGQAKEGPWLFQMLGVGYARMTVSYRRNEAWLRSAIAGVAAERFRQRRGRWPESLSEMVHETLDVVPLDPCDGLALRFRRLPDGIVIYSIGADGVDNGGVLERRNSDTEGQDLGFRLWDVKARRQKGAAPGDSRGRQGGP